MLKDQKKKHAAYIPAMELTWNSQCHTREFKLHVYRKRQTSDSSGEFLKTENEQIKAAPNNSCGYQIAWNY